MGFIDHLQVVLEPVERTRYSAWLRAGQPRGRSSSPGRVKKFLFFKTSRLIPGPTQPPFQWVPGVLFPGGKAAGA
jgi:hypothetical protein